MEKDENDLSLGNRRIQDVLAILAIGLKENEIKKIFNLDKYAFEEFIKWSEYNKILKKENERYFFVSKDGEEKGKDITSKDFINVLYNNWEVNGVTYDDFRESINNINHYIPNTGLSYAFFGLALGKYAEDNKNIDLAMLIYRYVALYCEELGFEERKKPYVRGIIRLSRLEFLRGISPKETLELQRKAVNMVNQTNLTPEDALLMMYAGMGEHFGGVTEDGVLLREKGIRYMKQFDYAKLEADALPLMAWHYYLEGDFKKTVAYYESFILALENRGDRSIITFAYPPVIFSYFFMGEYNSALALAEAVYRKARKERDDLAANLIYAVIGRIYLYKNEDKIAETILKESYAEGLRLNYGWGMYYSLCGDILLELKKGNYERCRNYIIASRKVAADENFAPIVASPFVFEALKKIKDTGIPEIPGYTYDQELEKYLKSNNAHLKGIANRHVAETLMGEEGNEKTALTYLRNSLSLLEMAGNTSELGKTCEDIAIMYLKLGDETKAKNYANRAWKYFDEAARIRMPQEILDIVGKKEKADDLGIELQTTWLELREIINEERFETRLLTTMCRTFGTESGVLVMTDRHRFEIKLAQNFDKSDNLSSQYINMEDAVKNVVNTGELKVGHNETTHSDEKTYQLEAPIFYIAIPFKQASSVNAVLYLQSQLEDITLTDREIEDIKNFANRISGPFFATVNASKLTNYGVEIEETSLEDIKTLSGKYFRSEDDEVIFILDQISKVAKTNIPVLITGETGVGKEVFAREVFENSEYKKTFIKVNCGAIPESLIESELFGYEKGSFTGAAQRKKGYFEMAEGGTILLDEIGELNLQSQVKLLRVLQEKELMRVGGTEAVKVDFRLIAATNKNLGREVDEGRFRKDLFYRLNVVQLNIPPLRNRKKDIAGLSYFFADKFAKDMGKEKPAIDSENLVKLLEYSWPGNVRELENVIQKAILFSKGNSLDVSFLMENEKESPVIEVKTEEKKETRETLDVKSIIPPDKYPSLEEVERLYIAEVVKYCNGKIGGKNGAASVLGLKRTTLISKMEKLGMK